MPWGKIRSALIGIACGMILISHAPPIIVDPVLTAVSQVRQGATATVLEAQDTTSVTDVVSKALKRVLR